MRTKDLTLIAVMAALICVAGPLSIAAGPIPISLCSFAVYLAGTILGWKRGSLAVLIYLLIGLTGVPVFSGFSGGVQKLAGVTGGYLVGYIPCAMIAGLAVRDGQTRPEKPWLLPAALLAGTAVLYVIGTAWFMIQTKNPLGGALSMCVLPFLPGDAAKIVAATLITWPVRAAIHRK